MSDSSAHAPKHALIIVRNNVNRDARVLKEAQSLTGAGHRVTVLGIRTSADDPPLELAEFCTIRRVTTTVLSEDSEGTRRAERTAPSGPRKSPYAGPLGEARNWAGRMRENRIYLAAALPLKPDVVISCDLTALPAGYWLKRRLGCRLIYDAHELFTEMSGAGGAVYRLLYGWTERYLIRRVDAAITVNDLIADELSRRYGVPLPAVVMNGPIRRVDAPSEVHEPVRVLYQGGYMPGRGLETLVREAGRLRGAAVLTLQGFGSLEATLKKMVVDEGLSDVVSFSEPCRPEEVVDAASAHDIGLAIYQPTSLNNRLASPNKLFDYMAAGIAVVGSDLPVMRRILHGSGAGVVFDPARVETAIDRVLELSQDSAALVGYKAAAHQGVTQYLWGKQVESLLSAIEEAGAGEPV